MIYKQPMKAICFSLAVMDFFPQQNKHFAGGNSLNQTIRYRQMGHQSAFVGALGTDDAGDRIASLLQAQSVDISHVHRINGQTASNKIVNDDAGERYSIEGSWNGGVYDKFELGNQIGNTSAASMFGQPMRTAQVISNL